jgi:uncharacterized protein
MNKQHRSSNDFQLTAIIKPLTACNLACSYCSVWEKKQQRMPLSLMTKILNQATSYAIDINGPGATTLVVFHGGEPLLMGLKYYEKTLEHIKHLQDAGKNIIPDFQTNASLIDKTWAKFFRLSGSDVSISLDGPKDIHDAIRKSKNGKGSYDRVVQGLYLLQEQGIDPWVCATIRKDSVLRLDEIYEHMKVLGVKKLYLGFLYPAGDGSNVIEDLGIPEMEWSNAISNLFDHWCKDEKRIPSIDRFNRLITNLQGKRHIGCNAGDRCITRVIGFMPDGNVYPCAVLAGVDVFNYGNIINENLPDIMNKPIRKHLLGRYSNISQKCKDCPYVSFCKGGCMHLSYSMTGTPNAFGLHCEKEFFTHVERKLLTQEHFEPIDRKAIIARHMSVEGIVPFTNKGFLRKITSNKITSNSD